MKKFLLLLHFAIGILNFTFSQTAPGIEWQNTIGGNGSDQLYSIQQTVDGGYILGGSSMSDISGDKTESCFGSWDYWIVKTDSIGNIQWQNTIGGSNFDQLESVDETLDGGYIIGGSSASNISGKKIENSNGYEDYWIVKVDFTGNIQWQNTIGGSGPDVLKSLQQTSDGGYILGGYSMSNISGDKTENGNGNSDFWIVKTDSLGNIQWQNNIGGSGYDDLYAMQQTSDRGYIIGGTSDSNISGDKSENSVGHSDYWIVKIDSSGTIQWQNTIGGNDWDHLFSVQSTLDGGYVLGGRSPSNISGDKTENCIGDDDYWIVKVDSAGNIQWQNTIGGTGHDALIYLQQTLDGGYILGGPSNSNISGDKTENNIGGGDYWIVKVDSLGNIKWQNTIGGSINDALSSIQQVTDGGYILGGYSDTNISGDKTENCIGGADYWILKLYPDTITGISNIQSPTNTIQLYPNPAKNEITISGYITQGNQPTQLKIFDVMGKEVLSISITNLNSQIINLKSFASGVYFMQLQSGLKVSRAKFVKQ